MVDEVHLSGHEGVGRVVVDDVRAAWARVDALWDDAVAHAATVPEPLVHERVDGEWSFVETMRHLVFADDSWVVRLLGQGPAAFHPLGVPPTDTTDAGAAEMGLTVVVREHADHLRFARRDLTTLEAR